MTGGALNKAGHASCSAPPGSERTRCWRSIIASVRQAQNSKPTDRPTRRPGRRRVRAGGADRSPWSPFLAWFNFGPEPQA
ncbi:MAG: hypothetical protein M0C28_06585 [Candidatus Moduliflexus flocculans]|nr:hypothetical protein [Candidatus Moduliflexus flocculans]